ncbi:MAG: redoxin domain-containing protein, partial [Proteobacteria bacterium]
GIGVANTVTDDDIEAIFARDDSAVHMGEGAAVGKRVTDFQLSDQSGASLKLSDLYKRGPVVLSFFPGDFTFSALDQLIDYRDAYEDFEALSLNLVGVTPNSVLNNGIFSSANQLPFKLLSDAGQRVSEVWYGKKFRWLLEQGSQGVFIVSQAGIIVERIIEPVTLHQAQSTKILSKVRALKARKQI